MDDVDPSAELRTRRALAALEALVKAGEHLLGEGQRLAPVEEATLRGSFELTIIVNGDRFAGPGAYETAQREVRRLAPAGRLASIDVEVAANTIYAARQHEETTWQHPLGGQAKYLEQPLLANRARYAKLLELADKTVTG